MCKNGNNIKIIFEKTLPLKQLPINDGSIYKLTSTWIDGKFNWCDSLQAIIVNKKC